jgi:hypothetical protein
MVQQFPLVVQLWAAVAAQVRNLSAVTQVPLTQPPAGIIHLAGPAAVGTTAVEVRTTEGRQLSRPAVVLVQAMLKAHGLGLRRLA